MKEVIAYKAFFEGLTNQIDNVHHEIGKEYSVEGDIEWMGNGYHMCEDPEDCFFYLKPSKAKVELTLVRGFGDLYSVDTGYKAYDDRNGIAYVCRCMEVLKVFTREEIIEIGLNLIGSRLEKFIERFPLTEEEALLFKEKFKDEYTINRNLISEKIDSYQKKLSR